MAKTFKSMMQPRDQQTMAVWAMFSPTFFFFFSEVLLEHTMPIHLCINVALSVLQGELRSCDRLCIFPS